MKRREFITLLGGAAVLWPLAASGQQPDRMRRIGVLMGYAESDSEAQAWVAAFREGLQKLGWAENRNMRTDYRWATGGDADLIHRFAKELVALQPDLILSNNTPNTAAMLQQTRTIPIIFVNVSDPIGSGFVASLPQPGGNVTGFITMEPTMAGKWFELLKEIAPHVVRVALLFNPATATYFDIYLKPFKAAAASFPVEGIVAPVHDISELESVVAAHAREPNSGLIVMPDPFLNVHRAEVTSLAARYRLPAVYPYRFYTEVGGLLSYGSELVDNFRRGDRVSAPGKLVRSSRWKSGPSKGQRPLGSECCVTTGDTPDSSMIARIPSAAAFRLAPHAASTMCRAPRCPPPA